MTPEGCDDTLIGLRLRLGSCGGFSLEGPDGVEARSDSHGWSIHGGRFDKGTRLVPMGDGNGRSLVDAAGTDLGSFSCLVGGTIAEDPPSVTLSDGRVFRVVLTDRGYAVSGWEGPGAYLEWVRDDTGWRILITVAGQGMDGLDRLIVLAAAAIARDEAGSGE